ncbi:MAG: hypothetical protein ACLVBP_13420 [Ruminococcus sp.]
MGSRNNSKAELDELNQLLQDANTYDISFSDVTRDGDLDPQIIQSDLFSVRL